MSLRLTAVLCLLAVSVCRSENSDPFPYVFGQYHEITCSPYTPKKGHSAEVYVKIDTVDGATIKPPLLAMLECLEKFQLRTDIQYTLSGFFTFRQYGFPDPPEGALEKQYLFPSQYFAMRPTFFVTRVVAPKDERDRFQRLVIIPYIDRIRAFDPDWKAPDFQP